MVPVLDGAIQSGAPVRSTPPAEYPVPLTSPVAVYAVVYASIVAVTRYSAALNESGVVAPRVTEVPSAWWPFNISTLNDVHIA